MSQGTDPETGPASLREDLMSGGETARGGGGCCGGGGGRGVRSSSQRPNASPATRDEIFRTSSGPRGSSVTVVMRAERAGGSSTRPPPTEGSFMAPMKMVAPRVSETVRVEVDGDCGERLTAESRVIHRGSSVSGATLIFR